MPYLVEVQGDYALFSRPELAVERMSYSTSCSAVGSGR